MIIGIGIDIIEISRIEEAINRNSEFKNRFFQKMKLNILIKEITEQKLLQVILQPKKLLQGNWQRV